MYLTLSKAEFKQYTIEQRALVRDRQRYGNILYYRFSFPMWSFYNHYFR